ARFKRRRHLAELPRGPLREERDQATHRHPADLTGTRIPALTRRATILHVSLSRRTPPTGAHFRLSKSRRPDARCIEAIHVSPSSACSRSRGTHGETTGHGNPRGHVCARRAARVFGR